MRLLQFMRLLEFQGLGLRVLKFWGFRVKACELQGTETAVESWVSHLVSLALFDLG